MNNKKSLRKEILNIRKKIDSDTAANCSAIICEKIINDPVVYNSDIILLYNSINKEIDCKLIFEFARKNKIICGFPKVVNNTMIFYEVSNYKDFEKGYFNIPEPKATCKLIDFNDVTKKVSIIVPGVIFNENLARCGYGGGFYDRFLKDKNFYKIGICYDFQISPDLIPESHDVLMNKIISEKRTIHD
jgi:5-formyltetrahydrofolate cyclo-ligase